MAKHQGDDGDWDLDSASRVMPSIRQRTDTNVTLTSSEQKAVMAKEEQFVASVHGAFNTTRFTDRRLPPDRDHVMPHGPDRRPKVKGGSYITQDC